MYLQIDVCVRVNKQWSELRVSKMLTVPFAMSYGDSGNRSQGLRLCSCCHLAYIRLRRTLSKRIGLIKKNWLSAPSFEIKQSICNNENRCEKALFFFIVDNKTASRCLPFFRCHKKETCSGKGLCIVRLYICSQNKLSLQTHGLLWERIFTPLLRWHQYTALFPNE